jgi:SpoVK/Ycf46/Vps4 family AAA+-type ATPase
MKEFQKRPALKDDDLIKELTMLIRSRYSLVCLETVDEERAESILKHLADYMHLPFFIWNINHGLQRADFGKTVYGTADPKLALDHIAISNFPAIYHLQGLGPFLDEDRVLGAKLTQVARRFTKIEGALVLTGSGIQIPEAAMPHTAFLSPSPPERQDYADLIQHIYRDLSIRMNVKVDMSKKDMNQLLNNLHGLTLLEAEKILTKAIIEDGRLAPDDLQAVIKAKKAIIERDGLLEYFPVEESMADIAGLPRLKMWLAQRKSILTEPKRAGQYGLAFPKGILLLGVPGCGKSLCAKAVATEWGLPLLKMDPSNLYNKYIGETEKNFKRAMVISEKMSPVVLWIDEIEKAFAFGDEDGGVSQRVLGLFLSWMQDRKGDVFIVATSNDVTRLPPEFLRKGRFDEIFFVDLPDKDTREVIFRIHLSRRGYDPKLFDLCRLAETTEGFSGAEIEQVVIAALYAAFTGDTPLTTDLLVEESQKTRPLTKTRAEYVQALRRWAKGRTASAQ